jgi:flavin reductase (DIM6/NTAB) family NADH-FMN oxidoreductase RutF
VVVTTSAEGKDNAMAAAWHMPVSFNPPLFAVSVSPKRFTYQQAIKSKEFAVNFMAASDEAIVAAVGGSKGSEIDKFEAFDIATEESIKTGAPVLKAAYAAYECKLVNDVPCGDHQLLVGEIVAVHTSDEAFDENGMLDLTKVTPSLYMGAEKYVSNLKCSLRTMERSVYGQPKSA